MTHPVQWPIAVIWCWVAFVVSGCATAPPAIGPPRKMNETLLATIQENMSAFDPTPYYPPSSLIVSPDSRHIAYAADTGHGWTVMVDDSAGAAFAHIFRDSFFFSPDSKRIAYRVDLGDSSAVVV